MPELTLLFIHDNGNGGKYVKIGYHKGMVDSNQWLKVQDKKLHNVCFSSNRRAFNSWLVGLIKCKECDYAVMIDIQIKKNSGKSYRYLIDYGWMTHTACVSRGYKIRLETLRIWFIMQCASV